jgi:hypothetical protein
MRTRALLIVLTLALVGCGTDKPAPADETSAAPHAPAGSSQILITIDAFAGRRVVPFGGTIAMPRLSAIATAGTTYDDTVSTATLARPALVTILTGVAPDRSGVRDNIHDALPSGIPTVAEGAEAAGYEAVGFVSTPFASYSSGLQRGFTLFDGPEAVVIGPAQHAPPVVKAKVLAEHFRDWLATRKTGAPYFVWIHFADLNGLAVPLPMKKIQLGEQMPGDFAAYDATIGFLDGAIGTIVDAVRSDTHASSVGLTLVGTHGAYLGEGGRFGDAFWLSEETLHVPLLRIKDVLGAAATASHEPRPTWLPDVAVTLAREMGFTLDARAEGIPLSAQPPPNRARLAWGYALDDQLGWPPQTAVREGTGFAVFTNSIGSQLRPTGSPSAEAANAAAARPALPRPRALSPDARAKVLGAGLKLGTSSPQVSVKTPDPWLHDLQLVRRLLGGERTGLAARGSKRMIDAEPNALASLVTRIYFFTTEPSAQGTALQQALLARYPDRSDGLHWASHVSMAERKYDQASALLDAAISVGPVEPEMYYDRACVRSLQGDPQGALADLDRALSAGYRNWDWIDKDPDLSTLRARREFPEFLQKHGR